MQNNIPIPTDNVFKFYAFFGLLLLIFSIGSTLYVSRTTNALLFTNIVDVETLKSIENKSPAESVKLAVLEKQTEIAIADKNFLRWANAALMLVSCLAIGYGFKKWHCEIQPILDETAKNQLESSKLELEKLRRELLVDQPSVAEKGRSSETHRGVLTQNLSEEANEDVRS